MDRFPYKDRAGYPLGEGCFVLVERTTSLGRSTFRGLVVEPTRTMAPGFLLIREWRHGGWTGKDRPAKPETCEVRRAPKALRADEAEKARITVRVRERAR